MRVLPRDQRGPFVYSLEVKRDWEERVRYECPAQLAEDDPFVPSQPFHDPRVTGNPHITLHICPHGGHCGFVGQRNGTEDDGYWAESQIVEFVASRA